MQFIDSRGFSMALVGRILREAGVPVGVWTPTPYALRLSLWRAGLS